MKSSNMQIQVKFNFEMIKGPFGKSLFSSKLFKKFGRKLKSSYF